MAEQERKTFKWGDQEYLLDDLLKLHAEQENNYYDFARNKGKYDETALQGLRSAITNRMNAVKNGQTFSADGVLDTDVVDNTSIQTQKKGLFKKEKYVDQDNTEWAKYYLNKLVSQLAPYQKPVVKDEGAWDITKHGLEAYLNWNGHTARSFFENYDKQDPNNPEAKRGFSQRDTELRKLLSGYQTWLARKNFDFTKNDNEWDDDFYTTLTGLINNSDWSDRTAMAASLRKLGAGDGYTTAFTSDRWDLSKTNEELDAEAKRAAEEKKAKEEKDKYAQYMKNLYSTYANLSDNNLGGTYFTSKGDGLFQMTDEEFNEWAETHTKDKDAYMNQLAENYYKNPFDLKIAGEYLPLVGYFGGLKDVNINGKTWSYDPRTIDRKNNRVVVFDKNTGEIKHTFLGDIEEELQNFKRQWRINNGYEDPSDKYTQYNEQGGVLTFQTGGGFNLAQSVNRKLEEQNKLRAEETGNTEEVQKARDRVVSNGKQRLRSEQDSIAQPDAGFTGAEVARLATIAADITSMFLDPVTGTAVGLASTAGNFVADLMDDGPQWEDVKNLGINAGFDLLGAIPLFGDALGTGTKITRQLLKWAPRAMAGLAAYQGVKNFDGMMDSWGKLTSGDKDQKLTVQDWRNIAQSISLLTGGVRATRNKVAQSRMKQQARLDDVVGVNVVDKNGNIQQVLVDGKIAEQVKAAKGSKAEVEKALSQLDEFKDKFGENGTLSVNVKNNGELQFNPLSRHTNPDGSKGGVEWSGFRKEGRADVNEVFDFSRAQGYNASRGFQIPGVSKYLNAQHQRLLNRINNGQQMVNRPNQNTLDLRGRMTDAEIDLQMKQILKDQGIDAQAEVLRTASDARTKSIADDQGKLTQAKTDLDAAKQKVVGYGDEASLQAQKLKLESDIAGMPSTQTMNNARQAYKKQQNLVTDLQSKHAGMKTTRDQHLDAIQQKKAEATASLTEATQKLTKAQKDLARHISTKNRLEKAFLKKYPTKIKRGQPGYSEYLKDLRAINRVNKQITGLQTTINGYNTTIADSNAAISKADVNTTKVRTAYDKMAARSNSRIRDAKKAMNQAQPNSNLYDTYLKNKGELSRVNQQLGDYDQIVQVQKNVTDLETAINKQTTEHTQAYKDLEALLANLRTSHASIGGRNMTWDINDIISRYNIQNAFKQGGSIDRNKINKFLNYAKG